MSNFFLAVHFTANKIRAHLLLLLLLLKHELWNLFAYFKFKKN